MEDSMNIFEGISCRNFLEIDGYFYFSHWFYNGLFKVEYKTGKTTFLGSFEKENLFQRKIHKEMFYRDGKIYFCPRRGRHVHIYNVQSNSITSIEIRKDFESDYIYIKVFLDEDALFLITKCNEFGNKKMNLETLKVTNVEKGTELPNFLLSCEDYFPNLKLISNYTIEHISPIFWKQIFDKVWYGFLPFDRKLLRYMEKKSKIEQIPLYVSNEEELRKHIDKIKREVLKKKYLHEDTLLNLQSFLDIIMVEKSKKQMNFEVSCGVGTNAWMTI